MKLKKAPKKLKKKNSIVPKKEFKSTLYTFFMFLQENTSTKIYVLSGLIYGLFFSCDLLRMIFVDNYLDLHELDWDYTSKRAIAFAILFVLTPFFIYPFEKIHFKIRVFASKKKQTSSKLLLLTSSWLIESVVSFSALSLVPGLIIKLEFSQYLEQIQIAHILPKIVLFSVLLAITYGLGEYFLYPRVLKFLNRK